MYRFPRRRPVDPEPWRPLRIPVIEVRGQLPDVVLCSLFHPRAQPYISSLPLGPEAYQPDPEPQGDQGAQLQGVQGHQAQLPPPQPPAS